MHQNNPIHAAIYQNVVKPALSRRRMSVEGVVLDTSYPEQVAQVAWRDPDSGAERVSERVPIPVDGDGIYRQNLQYGDRVTLSFRNGNISNPFISIIHERHNPISYKSEYGAGIPKGIGFL